MAQPRTFWNPQRLTELKWPISLETEVLQRTEIEVDWKYGVLTLSPSRSCGGRLCVDESSLAVNNMVRMETVLAARQLSSGEKLEIELLTSARGGYGKTTD